MAGVPIIDYSSITPPHPPPTLTLPPTRWVQALHDSPRRSSLSCSRDAEVRCFHPSHLVGREEGEGGRYEGAFSPAGPTFQRRQLKPHADVLMRDELFF